MRNCSVERCGPPLCYTGEALLQRPLEDCDGNMQVPYHSYQLMPEHSPETTMSPTELVVAERGMSHERTAAASPRVSGRAATMGQDYQLDQAQATSTRTAHRQSHFADEHGLQREMGCRLFEA